MDENYIEGRPEQILEIGPEFAELEEQLRWALRPLDPPAGFAARVLARAQGEGSPVVVPAEPPVRGQVLAWRARSWISGAIAAALVAGVLAGTSMEHHRAKVRRCAEATAQFQTAEQITDRAMQQVQAQMARAGVQLGE